MVVLDKEIKVEFQGIELQGHLTVPEGATSIILFAHGSGSGRRHALVTNLLQVC